MSLRLTLTAILSPISHTECASRPVETGALSIIICPLRGQHVEGGETGGGQVRDFYRLSLEPESVHLRAACILDGNRDNVGPCASEALD